MPTRRHVPLFPWLFPTRTTLPPWRLTLLVALGGAAGAVARAGVDRAWPPPRHTFPWSTWTVNVGGCLLMGLLMAVLGRLAHPRMWVGPTLGTGVLGGFTTFSAFSDDVRRLLAAGHPGLGVAYAAATVAGALAAVFGARLAVARLLPDRHAVEGAG